MSSDEDEYESLCQGSTPRQHMAAGALAGIMEHSIIYPVDCVKTRLQCLRPYQDARYTGLFHGLKTIVRTEGLSRTLRGLGAVVSGAGPAHAMYFACYEFIKERLRFSGSSDQVSYMTGAIFATLLHDAVMTPADAVKQRVQMYRSPYRNSMDCLVSVLRYEGPRALYRAYVTQLTMNIPFHVTHFQCYELGQKYLNPDKVYHPSSHMISGAFAGACAAALTNPLDVCKTLLNTQERCALHATHTNSVNSLRSAFAMVYQLQGFTGYFRGVQARVVYQMPGTAISWSVYEFCKMVLLKRSMSSSSSGSSSSTPPLSGGATVIAARTRSTNSSSTALETR